MAIKQNKSFFCHIWLHLRSSPAVSTATVQLWEDASLGGKSRSVLYSLEVNRDIKNNKAQCLEGRTTLGIRRTPVRTHMVLKTTTGLLHLQYVCALVHTEMF